MAAFFVARPPLSFLQNRIGCAIRYVAVARLHDRLPVARHAPVDTPASPATTAEEKVTRVLRSRRIAAHARLTITDHEVGCIHFDSAPPCMYLVVTPREVPQRVAFQFLADLAAAFEPAHGVAVVEAPTTARPWGLSAKAEALVAKVTAPYNGAATPVAGTLVGLSPLRSLASSRSGSLAIDVTEGFGGGSGGGDAGVAYVKGGSDAGDSPRTPPAGPALSPRSLFAALSTDTWADGAAGKFSWCAVAIVVLFLLLLVIGVPALVVLLRSSH